MSDRSPRHYTPQGLASSCLSTVSPDKLTRYWLPQNTFRTSTTCCFLGLTSPSSSTFHKGKMNLLQPSLHILISLYRFHHSGEHRAHNRSCLSHLHHWIPLFKPNQFNLICVFPVVCIFLSLQIPVHLCQLITSVTH